MDIIAKLRQLTEHFDTLSIEEFEKNLVISGIEEINSSNSLDMKLATIPEIEKKINTYTYSLSNSLIEGMECRSDLSKFSFLINEVA